MPSARGPAGEVEKFEPSLRGLGLGGAISINLTFGVVLGAWLLLADAGLPSRGWLVLVSLAVVLVGIRLAEVLSLKAPKRS